MVVRKRLKLTGHALVFVTTTVNDWLPVFKDERIAVAVLHQLRDTLNHYDVSLVGYVLMLSHLHAFLGFRHIEQLSKFMQGFKILSAKRIKIFDLGEFHDLLWKGGRFRLWKPRFDDLIITSEKQFRIKLDYIHNNPVKAGLASHACDWRYSSASDWLTDRPGLLAINKTFSWVK